MNKMWVAGCDSPNPDGGKKHGARTPKGMIERLVRREFSPTKMHKIISGLTDVQKKDLFVALLPYWKERKQSNMLSEEEIEALHDKLLNKVSHEAKEKKAG